MSFQIQQHLVINASLTLLKKTLFFIRLSIKVKLSLKA